ncbi:molybdopterin-dependent oxidoreductase [Capillimicrobium parvum]|uniref:molybdopterin-dependent oxidoreductase n=1 Tax=Capillimicrobium parvum TaxID=2884022 RepID=UPI00216B24AD|nr:molybdopterin-dependent oxidoreductase [Capillimicrobium parvum]
MAQTAFRTCPLCEATCGLELTLDEQGTGVSRVRGDADDVFSHGFLCPKGVALKELHEDPDRLRAPQRRLADGSFEACSWDEAFALVEAGLRDVVSAGGRNAVALYLGNPNAHNLSSLLYAKPLVKALGTRNVFTASTVDQYPKQLASGLMFGTATTVAVPDLDRAQHVMILGADPVSSNGSLMTAPDVRGRLQAVRSRGGRVVVVDPRRSRTAQSVADEHVFIRPGTDALLLMGMVAQLFSEGLVRIGRLERLCAGVDEVRALAAPFTPERVARPTGVPAEVVRRLAHDLAAADRGVVYGRMGTTTQAFGTVASWLVDVLNTLTGNLDRAGGAMFPLPATGGPNSRGEPGRGRGVRFGRWTSRVRGLPEVLGEMPAACLAEEIDTPGDDQVRALITLAGNPAVSTPNAGRLSRALAALDLMVCLDVYVTETSRHADVILPAPSPLERSHYDLALYGFAVRNVANYSPPVLPVPEGTQDEWRTLLRLTAIAAGHGRMDVDRLDDLFALDMLRREAETPGSPVSRRKPEKLLAELAPRRGPERLLDVMLRCGPYGDGFGARPDGLSLAVLESNPHGVDLGPLQPRLPAALRTPSGMIELAPPEIVADVPRLADALDAAREPSAMLLVGRRQLRSNNSWMHNLPLLVRGPARCTMQVHPSDAARLGLVDGGVATVRSRVGSIALPVEVTDGIMPGVVSIPHGWGHAVDGVGWSVAAEHAGANSNVLSDELLLDAVSGNAVLNGIPVEVLAAESGADGGGASRAGRSEGVGVGAGVPAQPAG